MFKRLWATELTENSATKKEELGVEREEYDTTYGYRKFIYVQVAAGVTVALGTALAYSDKKRQTVTTAFTVAAALGNKVAGVGIGAITAEYYGWIQTFGYHGGVKTDAGDDIVDGDTLVLHASTAGVCEKVAINTAAPYRPLGVAVADDIDADDTVNTFLMVS